MDNISILNRSEDTFWKKVFSLVIPIAFQQFMLSLVNASDAVMLGKLNQTSLAAVSLGGQIAFVLSLIYSTLTIGESMFVAQYWGKKDIDSVKRVAAFVMRYMIIASMLFTIAAIVFPEYLMGFFTNDKDLILLGSEYLRVVAVSYVFTGITQVYLCLMKNCGSANMSMIISSVVVIINIFLNWIFIFGIFGMPAFGIKGAALATSISSVIGMFWSFIYSLKKDIIKIPLKKIFVLEKNMELSFAKHVLPLLIDLMAWGIGFTTYSAIMGRLGTDAVAANSIANISRNIVICLCIGFGNAGGVIVGNELGAGNFKKAKIYGNRFSKLSIVNGMITGIILALFIPVIIHFTNLTPVAESYLIKMLLISSYCVCGKSINSMIIAGIFPAGGDSKFGMICDFVTLWCIIVPVGMIVAFVFKAPVMVVYAVLNLDEIIKLPVVYKHYKKYKWVNNLTIESL